MTQSHNRFNSPHVIAERCGDKLRELVARGDVGVSEICREFGISYGGSQARLIRKAAAILGLEIPNQRASKKANARVAETLRRKYAEDDGYRERISKAVQEANTPEVRQRKSESARKRFRANPGPVGGDKHHVGGKPGGGPPMTKEELLAAHRVANARYRAKVREKEGKPPLVPRVKKAKPPVSRKPVFVARTKAPEPPKATNEDEKAQVARFIAERGITKCPTAACAPTDATIQSYDATAVRKYHTEQQAAFSKVIAARVARGAKKRIITTAARSKRARQLEGTTV